MALFDLAQSKALRPTDDRVEILGEAAITRIDWRSEFEVGHSQLDDEHRLFVDLINVVYSGTPFAWLRPTLKSILSDIYLLAEQHIRNENAVLMKINSGPLPSEVDKASFLRAMVTAAFDDHIANHARMLAQLRPIIDDCKEELNGPSPKLQSALKEWFIGHVTANDCHLIPIFKFLGRAAH